MSPGKRILVTGGAGFIGSHTCKLLSRRGYLPITYDNLSTGHRDAARFGPFVQGDIVDRAVLDRALLEWRPIAVIHFAARACVRESFVAPDAYYRDNVVGLLTVMDAIRAAKVTQMVFSSSCATYGAPNLLPIAESAAQQPISPYGETKLIGERLIRDYARAFCVKYAILRYFNASGADREGELCERHDPETHVIPRALMAAARTIPHLDVFGYDHDTPDGACIRDYIHVDDLAVGHVRALDYLTANDEPLEVNLGSGKGTSIKQVLIAIESITGRNVPVRILPRLDGDPAVLYADPTKAKQRLDFATRHSDLDTIIGSAMKSFGL